MKLERYERDSFDYIIIDDCEILGHTMIFKANAANFEISRICFKYFLFFLHRSI